MATRETVLVTGSGSPINRGRVGVALVAVAYGIAAWSVVARAGTFTTYAGRATPTMPLFFAAGLGLIASGLFDRRRELKIGLLSVSAGFAWFAPVWDGWERGPALARAAGAFAVFFVLPLLFHLVVVSARRVTRPAKLAIGVNYAVAALLATTLALVRDPFLDVHCWTNCTSGPLVVSSQPRLATTLTTTATWWTALGGAILVGYCLARWPRLHSRYLFVSVGGALLGSAVVTRSVITIGHGFEDPNDSLLVAVFAAGCVATLVIACGPLWPLADRRRVARAMARVVEHLDDTPTTGSLAAALTQATRDPDLRVAYWLADSGRYADGQGRPVPEPLPGPGIIATPVIRDGRRIAVISHSAESVELVPALGSDLRLALDNERLQAEVLAQLHDLAESRSRIVEAGDERRRRLERNLHDGAQQSLLGLSYDVRVARAAVATRGASELVDVLDSASSEISQAFAELREVAHGIFPAVLSQAGISTALESLMETCPIPVDLECTLPERLPVGVETAVYFLVANGLDLICESGAAGATLTIARRGDHLTVDLIVDMAGDHAPGLGDTIHIADRLGAVGGTLAATSRGLEATIPCAS